MVPAKLPVTKGHGAIWRADSLHQKGLQRATRASPLIPGRSRSRLPRQVVKGVKREVVSPVLKEPDRHRVLPQIQQEGMGLLALVCGPVVVLAYEVVAACCRDGSLQRDGKGEGLDSTETKVSPGIFPGTWLPFQPWPKPGQSLALSLG